MRGLHQTFVGHSKRLLLVGDVHGCYDELVALMESVGFDGTVDQVVSVGDLFRKGPKNKEVMDWARDNHVLAVRGNHEQRLLKQRKKWKKGTFEAEDNPDTVLMSEFDHDDFKWLKALPFSIDFPAYQLLVVHAGLLDGKALEVGYDASWRLCVS
jgi:hypothetical protein